MSIEAQNTQTIVETQNIRSTAEQVDRARLKRAAWAFTTRKVDQEFAAKILPAVGTPNVGDLVLARIDGIGHHRNLHLTNGRKRHLFEGDEIVVAYGNRYASSQFESHVPETLGPCHLVAAGGVASRALSWHTRIVRGPTNITPIGLVGLANGQRLNISEFGLPKKLADFNQQPATIAIIGTSMDSGKTQTACFLARGLIKSGLKVGYVKVTGTGAGGDIGWLEDVGADPVLDFTDAGYPTTYLADHADVENILHSLIAEATDQGVDAIVVEVADGVLQRETAHLIASNTFDSLIGGIMLSAADAMGAAAGQQWIERNCSVPILGISGALCASPLQVEEAITATHIDVSDREELGEGRVALELIGQAQARQQALLGANLALSTGTDN